MTRRTAVFALLFALALVVGRSTVLPATGLALFWPAAGVAALWGMRVQRRRELFVATAFVVVLSTLVNALTGVPLQGAVLFGAASGVLVVGVRVVVPWEHDGVRGLRVDEVRPELARLTDVYRFFGATAVATLVSTALGMLGLLVVDRDPSLAQAIAWAVRNGGAVVTLAAPAIVIHRTWKQVSRRSLLAAVPHLLASLVLIWLVFGPGRTLPLSFLPFALVFWSGLRLPMPFPAVQGLLVALGTLALVQQYGGGPFGTIPDELALAVTAQAYMLLAVGLAVVVGTVQRERDFLLSDLASAARHSAHQAEDLKTITETIPDGILVVDRNGDIGLHNEAARLWVDVTSPHGIHDQRIQRIHPDGHPLESADRPVVRALAGETVSGAVMEVHDAAFGQSRTVAVDAVPMGEAEDGLPERVLLVFHDVSDEQERMRALIAERERTARLISDAPHGVAVLDLHGRILEVNESLASLAGRSVGELVGKNIADLSPSHRTKIAVYLERTLAVPGELLVGDWTIESPGGEDAHVSLTSRVLSATNEEDEVILVNVVDFSDRRRYEERLTHLADHDALTGLPNRRRFDEVLDEHLRVGARQGPRGSLLLLDLDHFKEVNDTMGHDAGDQLIVSIGSLLRDTLRSGDLVARVGGDEFAVLLPEADQAGAERVAATLVTEVREHCASLDGVKRRVSASVGVTTFAAAAARDVDPLALADMLLYDAKEAGRNQHAVLDATGTGQPRSGARLEWIGRIESALENDDFELYLQPILDVRTDRIVAAEALLRLVDRGEPVSPSRFVHIAERAGIAPALDRWVLRNGVEMLARLHECEPDLTLDINLSAHSIGDAAVERELLDALARHGVPGHRVVVEATETAAVSDVNAARAFGQRLAAKGVRTAIDDFGAGFGSFYYLKHLPYDIVKIDGEFVAGAHASHVDRAILGSIVGIARKLGKETTAEFVSQPAVLDVVRELGVDFAQGYLIGEPVPLDVFVARHLGGGTAEWTTGGPHPPPEKKDAMMIGGDAR